MPRIIDDALRRLGSPETSLAFATSEVEAARMALDWAGAGDVLILLLHGAAARATIVDLLSHIQTTPDRDQVLGGTNRASRIFSNN